MDCRLRTKKYSKKQHCEDQEIIIFLSHDVYRVLDIIEDTMLIDHVPKSRDSQNKYEAKQIHSTVFFG
jgi:hypothetical protein